MNPIAYESKHFPMIQSWFKHYNMQLNQFLLPPIGFIIENQAVGFLCEAGSPMCFLENLCKNPQLDKETTDRALDLVIQALFDKAQSMGIKLIVASTVFEVVKDRAVKNGATVDPDMYFHLYKSF
jgi:hypothetical protein